MEHHLFLLLLCAAVVVANSAHVESSSSPYYPRQDDFPNEKLYHAYFIIQRFKNTVSCDPSNITTTWIGHDICADESYRGFYCTAPPRHDENLTVTSINFNGFGLCSPRLQGFIDQLPDLAIFQATSNSLSGDIPQLSSLPYKYSLEVKNGLESSKFPQLLNGKHCVFLGAEGAGFGVMCGMYYLNNVHEKAIEIPGATDAKALLLSNNNLSGPLPSNLGFSKVSYLALANNKLTGTIPSSISHLQDSLFEVLLLNNQLSGCLPHELGMLYNAAVIDAGMNQLTGPIPASFSCLSSVEQLNLDGNRLYGQVPDSLCKLAGPTGRLANLTLSGNYFTSVGPACAALIKDGVLDVKNNCIPGLANQRRPAECAAFQSQPKTCPAASTTQLVTCPAAAAENAAAPGARKVRDYSSYVTYATLHD